MKTDRHALGKPYRLPLRAAQPFNGHGPRRRRGLPRLPVLISSLLLGGAAAYIAVCGYLVLVLTRTERWPVESSPASRGLEFETVRFPSRVDSLALEGWLISPRAGAPERLPVVFVHGKGGHRHRMLDGDIMDLVEPLAARGHPVLLFDMRGAGASAGTRFTLGAEEVRDVGGALDLMESRGLTRNGVALAGYSMGAATSLLAAAEDPRVRAVVVDSGYADLGDVLDRQVPKASGLPALFTPGIVLMARPLLGVDAADIRPIGAVPALAGRGVRLLVIHGEADGMVPVEHGRRIAAAYGPGVESYFVPGADHVAAYSANPGLYMERLSRFLDGESA